MLPEFLSFGKIDGTDASVWGLAVSGGTDTFKAPHQPKEGYSYDWGSENGKQFDLTSPVYKQARVFKLDCWVLADSVADFDTKYQALQDLFFSPGARIIYVKKFKITVGVKIKSFPSFAIPKGVYYEGSNYVGAEISIELDEVMNVIVPNYNIFYGASEFEPLTVSQVTALNSATDVMEITLNTGSIYKNFTMAAQSTKSILSVIDLDAENLDITSEYIIRRTLTIGGQNYKIYVMKTAIQYSTNHRHLITLQND